MRAGAVFRRPGCYGGEGGPRIKRIVQIQGAATRNLVAVLRHLEWERCRVAVPCRVLQMRRARYGIIRGIRDIRGVFRTRYLGDER